MAKKLLTISISEDLIKKAEKDSVLLFGEVNKSGYIQLLIQTGLSVKPNNIKESKK